MSKILQAIGVSVTPVLVFPPPVNQARNPTGADTNYPPCQNWFNTMTREIFVNAGDTAGVANWTVAGVNPLQLKRFQELFIYPLSANYKTVMLRPAPMFL